MSLNGSQSEVSILVPMTSSPSPLMVDGESPDWGAGVFSTPPAVDSTPDFSRTIDYAIELKSRKNFYDRQTTNACVRERERRVYSHYLQMATNVCLMTTCLAFLVTLMILVSSLSSLKALKQNIEADLQTLTSISPKLTSIGSGITAISSSMGQLVDLLQNSTAMIPVIDADLQALSVTSEKMIVLLEEISAKIPTTS